MTTFDGRRSSTTFFHDDDGDHSPLPILRTHEILHNTLRRVESNAGAAPQKPEKKTFESNYGNPDDIIMDSSSGVVPFECINANERTLSIRLDTDTAAGLADAKMGRAEEDLLKTLATTATLCVSTIKGGNYCCTPQKKKIP